MKKPTPLPPGEYAVTVDRIRKVRGKPVLKMHLKTKEGKPITMTIQEKPCRRPK